MDAPRFEESTLLFGRDRSERIVAAELAGRFIRLFYRTPDGVYFHDDPFHPFIILTNAHLLSGFPRPTTIRTLAGSGEFRHLALFNDWRTCLDARDYLVRTTSKTPSAAAAPYLFFSDPIHQHLLLTGKTLFKQIEFPEIRRLALDIETWCAPGFEFSNPLREEDRIISVAVLDSEGYEEVLSGHNLDEPAMLERLNRILQERDPDVIEGHNIFRFDLEYLRIRAARHGIRLAWGRDGSEPRVHPSRFTVAERIVDYPRWNVYGRHIIDTYFLLLVYDVGNRDLESYGLKAAARHFGLARPNRVYLEGSAIARTFLEDPQALADYNLDDVRETLALSRLLSYPYFLQTRMFPYSYQNCPIRGNATKINALFLREYLHRETAIPRPSGDGELEGGYNNLFVTGVVGPVAHCDVASLYPSILLAYRLQPDRERLGLFLPLLDELRTFRLRAKKMARETPDPHLRDYYQALQQAFKVLINSFYGYLGTTIHNFADMALAAEVTLRGREIIQRMLDWLAAQGARPVEVDTDGIYFIPPAGVTALGKAAELIGELSTTLPAGIDVEMDGWYRAMFSYKMKNYALLDDAGRMTIKGSGLKSRGTEKYLRDFTSEVVRLLLHGEGDRIDAVYQEYLQRLRDHAIPIDRLEKTETLNESPASYQQKVQQGKRLPAAAFELALQSERDYQAGDQISYYVTGHAKGVAAYENCRPVGSYDPTKPDENVEYYKKKLRLLHRKFIPFLPAEKSLFE
ncbi:DNA polymerase domain-containing protein [Geobacter sp. AOG1]|uniref:DNA polymerase domain-containing protein n=1 Tax=Geobacter sp. AOG1 TaxID=1566346 RepID=UPI001CC74608|nr:DNA polymerase domain-containing protein [Geobacter sp. AOG1]GFE57296.1 DNA polymerase II [Geobacter sp. AOG1]